MTCQSLWQTPDARIFTRTSRALGGSSSHSTISSGVLGANRTAAFIGPPPARTLAQCLAGRSINLKKRCVRSCFGRSSTSSGVPCSTITPSSMNTTRSATSRAKRDLVRDDDHRHAVLGQLRASPPAPRRPVPGRAPRSARRTASACGDAWPSARAIATRCCWPPDSCDAEGHRHAGRGRPRSSSARAAACAPRARLAVDRAPAPR